MNGNCYGLMSLSSDAHHNRVSFVLLQGDVGLSQGEFVLLCCTKVLQEKSLI